MVRVTSKDSTTQSLALIIFLIDSAGTGLGRDVIRVFLLAIIMVITSLYNWRRQQTQVITTCGPFVQHPANRWLRSDHRIAAYISETNGGAQGCRSGGWPGGAA